MENIKIVNAYANNLKHISVDIPIGKITAITGVSGSGKSTLLKNILATYGYKNFSRIASKTIQNELHQKANAEVEEIRNLPAVIFIDVKNSVKTPFSTVSTVSGLHEMLRNLFLDSGEITCINCTSKIKRNYSLINQLRADFKIGDELNTALEYINENGRIYSLAYFDSEKNPTEIEKRKAYATVDFSLSKINEKQITSFNNTYACRVHVVRQNGKTYDFLREIECDSCGFIMPNLIRSRFSFITDYNDGGGACTGCGGSGKTCSISINDLFSDTSKGIISGSSPWINQKGLKYTTVTEKCIFAVYKTLKIPVETPIHEIEDEKLKKILYGIEEEISFTDRVGGKKKIVFKGIANYLTEVYATGRGNASLQSIFSECDCQKCNGTRFDERIKAFSFMGMTFADILQFSLKDLGIWAHEKWETAPTLSKPYLRKILDMCENFEIVSCSHLGMFRATNTLSGGEIQRIRICSLLNSGFQNICFLLDEPSSGLHYSDIENLAILFERIKNAGNTIILVEHNKKLLSYCDYIVDMGPAGGKAGGSILFADKVSEIKKYDTVTAEVLKNQEDKDYDLEKVELTDFMEFKNITAHNLKNISVKIPKNAFSVVCGVSGSGKSTFVKEGVLNTILRTSGLFDFSSVEFLAQSSRTATKNSTVATILNLGNHISKIFAKKSSLPCNYFLPGSAQGKCANCQGSGILYSDENELLGICEQCNGTGFSDEVMQVKISDFTIYDFYNTDFETLALKFGDKKISNYANAAKKLGLGYVTLARNSKTLSKGELQRVTLVKILSEKAKNTLLLLDEPSKGLHASDAKKLLSAIRSIIQEGNTIIAIEHNADLIKNADYIVEFGGTGNSGGKLLFQGRPKLLEDTPTAKMLHPIENCFLEKSEKKQASLPIKIKIPNKELNFVPFTVYKNFENPEILIDYAKATSQNFLSVIIPNNAMFSKSKEGEIHSDAPLTQIIDFSKKIDYEISIMDALGINDLHKKYILAQSNSKILQYVFDSNSKTGKCNCCVGKGTVFGIDENYFLENGNLTADCKKFLRNSTDFYSIAKTMKKEGLDMTKSIADITENEYKMLFWGSDRKYFIEDKIYCWKGIIQNFIEYHKYYDKKNKRENF